MSHGKHSKLRACLMCSYLQEAKEFKNRGCPNCPFLDVR